MSQSETSQPDGLPWPLPPDCDEAHRDGYRYSRFLELYQRRRRKLDVVLRQQHRAGEKLFVDYAGATVAVENPQTGEVRAAQIFVAVLGAGSYTYAEATSSQDLPNGSRDVFSRRHSG